MDKDNGKIILVCFVLSGVLASVVIRILMETLAASWGTFARFYVQESVQHVVPVAVGFITFAALQLNKKVRVWMDEVVTEVSKVVWPTKKDTTAMTTVTCVMLLISGLILGFFDFVSSGLVGLLTDPSKWFGHL